MSINGGSHKNKDTTCLLGHTGPLSSRLRDVDTDTLYWHATNSRRVPYLTSALLHHFSYKILCVDKMTWQCIGEKWSLARIGRMPVLENWLSLFKFTIFIIFCWFHMHNILLFSKEQLDQYLTKFQRFLLSLLPLYMWRKWHKWKSLL